MRILLLANNWVGWHIASWLRERGDQIVGLILHPPHKRKYGDEIVESVGLQPANIFDGSRLCQPEVANAITRLQADVGLSILFDYILHPEFIHLFPAGIINLHPSYLPYNRGQHPNVWSIIESTSAGVTLHYIDAGADTGDIIAQAQVLVEPIDTGETLYRKLEHACVKLFKENWPLILSGKALRVPQSSDAATYHRARDVERVDEIDLDRTYTARELINILRARTFPPYTGAYFFDGRRKIYMRLKLFYDDESESNPLK